MIRRVRIKWLMLQRLVKERFFVLWYMRDGLCVKFSYCSNSHGSRIDELSGPKVSSSKKHFFV